MVAVPVNPMKISCSLNPRPIFNEYMTKKVVKSITVPTLCGGTEPV